MNDEPHLVTSDNMGNPHTYWRQFRRVSDGSYITAVGATQEQAIEDAAITLGKREEYLALSPLTRLQILINQDYLLQREITEAIKIIGYILINERQNG